MDSWGRRGQSRTARQSAMVITQGVRGQPAPMVSAAPTGQTAAVSTPRRCQRERGRGWLWGSGAAEVPSRAMRGDRGHASGGRNSNWRWLHAPVRGERGSRPCGTASANPLTPGASWDDSASERRVVSRSAMHHVGTEAERRVSQVRHGAWSGTWSAVHRPLSPGRGRVETTGTGIDKARNRRGRMWANALDGRRHGS